MRKATTQKQIQGMQRTIGFEAEKPVVGDIDMLCCKHTATLLVNFQHRISFNVCTDTEVSQILVQFQSHKIARLLFTLQI